MNRLKIFKNDNFGLVRTLEIGGDRYILQINFYANKEETWKER